MDESPAGHDDLETIPQVVDVIKALGKETEPGVFSAKQKVEVWRYNSNLVFKPGEYIVSFLLALRFILNVSDYLLSRTWIYWIKTDRWFIQGNYFVNLIVVLSGMVGRNFVFFFLTIIVRKPFFAKSQEMVLITYISVVMTKPKDKDGVPKYQVHRRVSTSLCIEIFSL